MCKYCANKKWCFICLFCAQQIDIIIDINYKKNFMKKPKLTFALY